MARITGTKTAKHASNQDSMKIPLTSLNPKVTELIESNNQHEALFVIMSDRLAKLEKELQNIKDDNQRKRSMEF